MPDNIKETQEDNIDVFGELYIAQRLFQERIQATDPLGTPETQIGSPAFVRLHTLSLIAEATEAMNETPWKPWKKQQTWNHEAFREELIDCQVFLMNLMNAANMKPKDIYDGLANKIDINHGRQDDGY